MLLVLSIWKLFSLRNSPGKARSKNSYGEGSESLGEVLVWSFRKTGTRCRAMKRSSGSRRT
ncbi:hypothetical protein AKJ39_03740 [candidate division MSBL1 archaeon SCGC-AAA259J03]|uniref:Uncharacterized protein n=1 Tax=candidate division MSBL1 archaeon SCGC-AAA259J03 TaxID=1698269 RepID=A0A656YVE3_9EURY|nr:hypothetical protein AKJ39_03740 [candidate division MSBL1 archaeon SCGC-AAA259J03]